MTTVYLPNETYLLSVWKKNGVLYIQNRQSGSANRTFVEMSEQQQRFMYYGYQFENFCTGNDGDFSNACFAGVFKSKIGKRRVLFGAEIDCFDDKKNDVELKVTKQIKSDRDKFTFERYKLLKWYAQSFLSGTRRLVVGFRDFKGHLHHIQQFDTLKIPSLIRQREKSLWCPSTSLEFLNRVVEWLCETVSEQTNQDSINELEYRVDKRTLELTQRCALSSEKIHSSAYF